jgi:hypothetical protein
MEIGIISDTHVKTVNELPATIVTTLAGVDLIVHAGDFTERPVLEGLRRLGVVKAVCGNMDSGELKRILPQKELFVVGRKKVGLIHGWGGPWGIANRVRDMFSDVDIIIFGHSHQPCNEYIGGSLLFNPGRASDSFGLLTINDGVRAEIIKV